MRIQTLLLLFSFLIILIKTENFGITGMETMFPFLECLQEKAWLFVSLLDLFYCRDLLDWDFSIQCTTFLRLKSIRPALLHKNQCNEVFKNMLWKIRYGVRIFCWWNTCILFPLVLSYTFSLICLNWFWWVAEPKLSFGVVGSLKSNIHVFKNWITDYKFVCVL